jgi:hypothetical protein
MTADQTPPAAGEVGDVAMAVDDVTKLVAGMPGVVVVTASEDNGAPEIAWGDTFFYYDPDGDIPPDRRLPFATIVVHDYEGFDTSSNLNRPGVFRLNIAVGRDSFRDLIGHSPAAHADHRADVDYSALDELLPHPAYATQSWIAILNPGEKTAARARALLHLAHARARARHRDH